MARTSDIDVQAQAVLTGLRFLGELLEGKVARDALDLSKNAQTANQYDILSRVRKSLTQYLERDGDLFYVGLLGHFSSGKSSTINSLLGTWNTKQERETGLNPTDKTITLITHEKNIKSLLGVIREGHVTIRSLGVKNHLLDNLVLVDTPGTGDPHLIEEIARDFLPICDVILFLFSAASPLDQTDIPLLSELNRRLPFIPIKFLVTRADELRSDFSKPISDNNIDINKKSRFFTDVLSRLNILLKPIIYTEEDFVLIDNKANYNIDILTEFVKARCDPMNPHARISMHGYKLHFFLSAAKELRAFFARFLDDKLAELNKIVEAADRNIRTYNENVRISNSHLTKNWGDQHGAVIAAGRATLARLEELGPFPTDCAALDPVITKQVDHKHSLSSDARNNARNAARQIKFEVERRIHDHMRDIERRDADIKFDNLTAGGYRIPSPTLKLEFSGVNIVQSRAMANRWLDVRLTETDAIQKVVGRLRKAMEETETSLQQRAPLTECEKQVNTAQESLRSDLSQFYRNVELYRDGVFSLTTKESISTLGIGAQLDALEPQFADTDKATFAAETMRELFPDFGEFSAKTLTRLIALDDQMRPLIEAVNGLKLPTPDLDQKKIEALAEQESTLLLKFISSEIQKDVDEFSGNLTLALSSHLIESRRRYDVEMEQATKRRRRRYLGTVAIAGGLGLSCFGGYRYLAQGVSSTIFETLGWGILANLLGDCIGYTVARLYDDFPQTKRTIRESFEVLFRRDVNSIMDREIESYRFAALDEVALSSRLDRVYQSIVSTDLDTWHSRASEFLRVIDSLRSQYEKVRASYVETVIDTVQKIAGYFSDATKNLEALNMVASRIKERAIEPSFTLLDQTRLQLDHVKKQIQTVEFS